MFGRRQYLLLGLGHVFLASGNDKHGFFTTHRSLDVRIGLGAQSLDFTAWGKKKKRTQKLKFLLCYWCTRFAHTYLNIKIIIIIRRYSITLI